MSQGVPHCTFCDLIRGAAEVSICHEDAESIAFMDIQPVNVGHVLVVPREHYESLLDVPPEIGVHLFRVTMQLAGAPLAVHCAVTLTGVSHAAVRVTVTVAINAERFIWSPVEL